MNKASCSILVLLMTVSVAIGQHTVRIELSKLPANHPPGSSIYIAGSFNKWNPGDANFIFHQQASGSYAIDLQLAQGEYEFKFTRGDWSKVECNMDGSIAGNHSIKVSEDTSIRLTINGWQDRFADKPRQSTASKQVHIMDTAFWMPQLKRARRIWIYLPESYVSNGQQRYNVLYIQDGQNVFDDATAFAGEWGVDETVNKVSPSTIVVAIDNGGDKRMNEYNPYDDARYGKGEGDAYVDFIVKTLKPYIDKHYRTNKGKSHTAIAGSSMGGLISMYAILKYPKVFGGAGIFSASFWIAPRIYDDIRKRGKKVNANIYFYAGKMESEHMVPDMLKVFMAMRAVSKSKMTTVIRDEGKHNEATWKKEFGVGLHFMFNGNPVEFGQ